MKRVIILVFPGTPLSSIALPTDIFNAAGTLWNQMAGLPITPHFKVEVATIDGLPVRCHKTVEIIPDMALNSAGAADLVIIGALLDPANCALRHHEAISLLKDFHHRGATLASICSGAFLLAATGLLDNRTATTHWALSRLFHSRYPKVELRNEKTVTDEGRLLCSGGANAGADLALHLVRRYCGDEVADQCSRVLLLDPHRSSQSPYEILNDRIDHGDQAIARIQAWIHDNFQRDISVAGLAELAYMSRRTFERRFRLATGESPLRYLQRLRIQQARRLLENGHSFDEITGQVGYEDTSSFRKLFQRHTSLPPASYREKFRRT